MMLLIVLKIMNMMKKKSKFFNFFKCFNLNSCFNRYCIWTHTYRTLTLTCNPPHCLNIFNTTFLMSDTYASYNQQPIYFPFQQNPTVDPFTNYLQISRPKSVDLKLNFCIQFYYQAKEIPLMVSSSKNEKDFFQVKFTKNTQKDVQKGLVCASHLNPNVTNVKSLFFRFLKSPLNNKIHLLQDLKMLQIPASDSSLLTEGIYMFQLSTTQFWDFNPHWISFNSLNNSIKFEANELQARKMLDSDDIIVTTISSKWIPAIPENSQFRLTVTPEIFPNDVDLYNITFIVSSPNKNAIIKKSLLEINPKAINIFQIPFSIKEYQLTIEIQLDPKKVCHQDSSTITFSRLTINDLCLTNTTELNSCTEHGQCIRDYNSFSSTCKCSPGYLSSDCSEIDFCKTNLVDFETKSRYTNSERFCKGRHCTSISALESFSCECESKETWDYVNRRCTPQVVDCLENQVFTISELGKGSCSCIESFIMNSTSKVCVPVDVCIENHRKFLSLAPTRPCEDLNAKCTTKRTLSFPDYECICNEGYSSEFGK